MADPRRLLAFLDDSLDYFLTKSEGVSRDRYFADRDVRSILDKTINDIILRCGRVPRWAMWFKKGDGRKLPVPFFQDLPKRDDIGTA